MGIGFAAPAKPAGIDAFAPGGGGTIGEGSALAWKWNQLTGEKVWVLNTAKGGSTIIDWLPSSYDSGYTVGNCDLFKSCTLLECRTSDCFQL